MTTFDLHTEEGRKAYRATLLAVTTEDLQALYAKYRQDHATDMLSDHARGMAGQKAAIIGDVIEMRLLREKFLGQEAAAEINTSEIKANEIAESQNPNPRKKRFVADLQAMSDEEYNAFRISVSSRSVEALTEMFNDLSKQELKPNLTPQERRVLAEKKKLVNASREIRKHGGFQG